MIEPRRYLSKKQQAEMLLAFKGCCGICGGKFKAGEKIEWDHKLALALGGTNDVENFQPVHGDAGQCHKQKSAQDVKAIAKGKRQAKKFGPQRDAQPKRFKVKIASRGFSTTLRKTMAGKVVPRIGKAKIA